MNNVSVKFQIALIALSLALLTTANCVRAEESSALLKSATRFARVANDQQGQPVALQVAIATFAPENRRSKLTVDLVSAVHIGDPEYYDELNERFRDYDVLLYELVAPEGRATPAPDAEREGIISNTQLTMMAMLDLSFQLDEIDYRQPNFVHADMSPSQLRQSMDDRGESLYVYFWRIFFATIDEYTRDPLGKKNWRMMSAMLDSGEGNAFKIMLAHELAKTGRIRDMLDGGSGSAVIASRNEHAVGVLREQIAAGATRIGIFYGVAHMPDFEERLAAELQLLHRETTWIDAWRLN